MNAQQKENKRYFKNFRAMKLLWWLAVSLIHTTKDKKLKPARHRSSRPEVFCKEGILINFAKFNRKTTVLEFPF